MGKIPRLHRGPWSQYALPNQQVPSTNWVYFDFKYIPLNLLNWLFIAKLNSINFQLFGFLKISLTYHITFIIAAIYIVFFLFITGFLVLPLLAFTVSSLPIYYFDFFFFFGLDLIFIFYLVLIHYKVLILFIFYFILFFALNYIINCLIFFSMQVD